MSNIHTLPHANQREAEGQPHALAHAYAELAISSNFSFLRGASHPEEFVKQAKVLGLTGIGIADRNSVAGVVRAYKAAEELNEEIRALNRKHDTDEPELKLAVGARLVFADGTPDILAYPRDRAAWGRLTRLLTAGKSRADKGGCILFLDDLIEHSAGLNLIVLPPARLPRRRRNVSAHSRVSGNPEFRTGSPPSRGRAELEWDDGLEHTLFSLKDAASPRSVWLGASMLYRGDDSRRLARLAAIAADARIPLIAVTTCSITRPNGGHCRMSSPASASM